jgi:preprotein translocase subunit YajC
MSGSGFAQFVPLILIFVIFYFFLIRPQQKKIKDHKAMVQALKRGDEIVTSGGIVGTIEKVHDDDKIDVLISDNVTIKVIKSTIQSLLNISNTKK